MKIKKLSGSLSIWGKVIDLILSKPKVLLPFCFLAIIETLTLYVLASSPHFPVNLILAPPIRRIWGEVYLHYPYIYELLPRMFYWAKIVVAIFVGSITSGMAVYMVFLLQKKEALDLKSVFFSVLKRYVSLFLLAIILFTCVHFLLKQTPLLLIKYFQAKHLKLLFLGPKFWFNIFMPVFNFFLTVILQCLFVYSIPFIVIKGKKFISAIISGIRLFGRLALKTFFIVLVPMCLYIPVVILTGGMAFLADKFFPEVIIFILFLGVVVGTIIVDSLVTLATTLVFIEEADEK